MKKEIIINSDNRSCERCTHVILAGQTCVQVSLSTDVLQIRYYSHEDCGETEKDNGELGLIGSVKGLVGQRVVR
jgi:hypothetical protein